MHEHIDAAREAAERAVRWFEARPPYEAITFEHRQWHGRALFLAGRGDEAKTVYNALVQEFPDRFDIRAARAFIAATQGDTAQALSDREWFGGRTQNTMWQRGIIAGVLGDHDRAAELLRQAAETRDWFYFWDVRNTVLYAPLCENPDFQELLRPKG